MIDQVALRENRLTGIGGSDVAAIIGMSKWRTALDVYLQKRELTESEDDVRKEMGRYMEAPILQWYVDHFGVDTVATSEFVRHPEFPFLIGNVDMEVESPYGDRWGLDAKNVHFKAVAEWGDEGSDEMPLDALFQAHHYLFLKPAWPKIEFVVLRGGHWPPRVYSVVRDNELYSDLVLPRLTAFWNDHVLLGVPPSPDFADEKTLGAIKAMFPPVAEKSAPVNLSPVVQIGENAVSSADLAEAYDVLGKIEKEAAGRRKKVEAALRALIGDAKSGQIGEVIVDRVFNKGGFRPASEVAPYDYLKLKFPKNYETKLTASRIAGLLGESNG